MSAVLAARSSKYTCPPLQDGPPIVPLIGSMSYRRFASILSAACALASFFVISLIVFQHASNYSSPIQQRQIIRILLLVPYVSIFCVLIVWKSNAGEYLMEALDVGCAIALSSFLLLLCDYVLSHPEGFDELFGPGAMSRGPFEAASPKWLKRIWYAALQYIPTSLIIWLATVISEAAGTYCAQSKSLHFAHIWVSVFKALTTIIALVAVIKFYGRMKHRLREHSPISKLIAFKSIIGLSMAQTFIINILFSRDAIGPTKYMTNDDVLNGLPALILACEMPIFSVLLYLSFSAAPYKGRPVQAPPATALYEALNISDLLSAFVRGPMRLIRDQEKVMAHDNDVTLLHMRATP